MADNEHRCQVQSRTSPLWSTRYRVCPTIRKRQSPQHFQGPEQERFVSGGLGVRIPLLADQNFAITTCCSTPSNTAVHSRSYLFRRCLLLSYLSCGGCDRPREVELPRSDRRLPCVVKPQRPCLRSRSHPPCTQTHCPPQSCCCHALHCHLVCFSNTSEAARVARVWWCWVLANLRTSGAQWFGSGHVPISLAVQLRNPRHPFGCSPTHHTPQHRHFSWHTAHCTSSGEQGGHSGENDLVIALMGTITNVLVHCIEICNSSADLCFVFRRSR